jgi:hypothetical protein
MEYHRGMLVLTVTIIVATTLVSGPLVGAVDFTTTKEDTLLSDETDRATIRIAAEPQGNVTLDRGEFGNEVYSLNVPDVTIRAPLVRGTPRVTYQIRIRELRYSRVTSYFLGSDQQGETITLDVQSDTIERGEVTEPQYRGELIVTVHDSDGATAVYRTNRTVVVSG